MCGFSLLAFCAYQILSCRTLQPTLLYLLNLGWPLSHVTIALLCAHKTFGPHHFMAKRRTTRFDEGRVEKMIRVRLGCVTCLKVSFVNSGNLLGFIRRKYHLIWFLNLIHVKLNSQTLKIQQKPF